MWLGNDNSVDLNRNFDIFFGRLRGHNLRLGKLFGRIKIPFIKFPPNKPYKWWRNCGRYPFSEPESRALRDLMISLNNHDFSFYVNCHTATHNVVTPWVVFKPPFEMKQKEKDVFVKTELQALEQVTKNKENLIRELGKLEGQRMREMGKLAASLACPLQELTLKKLVQY